MGDVKRAYADYLATLGRFPRTWRKVDIDFIDV